MWVRVVPDTKSVKDLNLKGMRHNAETVLCVTRLAVVSIYPVLILTKMPARDLRNDA